MLWKLITCCFPGCLHTRRRPHQTVHMSDYQIVFFDLETTGLDTDTCHIIQLSAISGDHDFNAFTYPHRHIDEGASRVTGFTTSYGRLYRDGYRVHTIPLADALNSFIEYLQDFDCPVLLAAHNGKRFDAPVLTRVMEKFSLMQEFEDVVTGFLDTLVLSKNLYHGLERYSQEYLVDYFLGTSYNAHDAEEDSRMLQELVNYWRPKRRSVRKATFDVQDFL